MLTDEIRRARWAKQALLTLGALLVMTALASCGSTGQTPPQATATPTIAPTATANPINSYVGSWTVHDERLTINANATGSLDWNAGPCATVGGSSLCAGLGNLNFTTNLDGSLTGTYQSISYVPSSGQLAPGYQPSSDDPKVGDTITLKHDGAHLLSATSNSNSWSFCDAYALANGWIQCGA
jgi:hypothetical protein